jgi:hypothetical protein
MWNIGHSLVKWLREIKVAPLSRLVKINHCTIIAMPCSRASVRRGRRRLYSFSLTLTMDLLHYSLDLPGQAAIHVLLEGMKSAAYIFNDHARKLG